MKITIKIEHKDILDPEKIYITSEYSVDEPDMDLYEFLAVLERSISIADYSIGDQRLDLVDPKDYSGDK